MNWQCDYLLSLKGHKCRDVSPKPLEFGTLLSPGTKSNVNGGDYTPLSLLIDTIALILVVHRLSPEDKVPRSTTIHLMKDLLHLNHFH